MSWLNQKVSLYTCHADNTGRAATYREILFSEVQEGHKWYCKNEYGKWENGFSVNMDTINQMRKLDSGAADYNQQKLLLKLILMICKMQ